MYLDICCLKYAAKISQTASHPLRQYIPPIQRTGKTRHILLARPKCRTSLCSKNTFNFNFFFFCTWSNLPLQALIGVNKVNIYLSILPMMKTVAALAAEQNCICSPGTKASRQVSEFDEMIFRKED